MGNTAGWEAQVAGHFADNLLERIAVKKAPACVGIDPLLSRLPPSVLAQAGLGAAVANDDAAVDREAAADALLSFGCGVVDAVAGLVPIVKINIAFFERYYSEGYGAYGQLVRYAQQAGLLVIGDIKRADIGHSTTQYALAHLQETSDNRVAAPNAVTVNPYFGFDAIKPFVEIARETGRGLFALVQTSNPSAEQVQGLTLTDGMTLCQGVAKLVQEWASGEGLVGGSGYSCIGAVVSPRDIPSTERIRALMPNCLFLVPGFGAQGRSSDEVRKCFKPDGTGAVVTASRSVIYAYDNERYRETAGDDWRACVEQGCKDFVSAIANVMGM